MTRFWEFVHSPFHNKHKKVRLLVTYLRKIHPDFNIKKLNTTTLLDQFAEYESFDEQELTLTFTYTLRLFYDFNAKKILDEENIILNKLLTLQGLRKNEQTRLYQKFHRGIQLPATEKGSKYYHTAFALAAEENNFFGQNPSRENQTLLIKKQVALDHFYFVEKIKDACEMLIRSQILKVPFDINMLDAVITEIDAQPTLYADNPVITSYLAIYKLLSTNDLSQYDDTLKLVLAEEKHLPNDELKGIYNYLQNFCIRQINSGHSHFLAALFYIYEQQLERNLLHNGAYLSEFHLKNIVTVGLRLKRYEQVLAYMNTYHQLLDPSIAANAQKYNLANYYYATQQYEAVIEQLQQVEYTDIRYNLDAKSLLLRTYFELNEEVALFSLFEAFRQFLKRNSKVSDDQKRGYLNLMKITKQAFVLKINMPYQSHGQCQKQLNRIKKNMEEKTPIFNRDWLQEKVSLLEVQI